MLYKEITTKPIKQSFISSGVLHTRGLRSAQEVHLGDVDGAVARRGTRKAVANLDVHLSRILLSRGTFNGTLNGFASLQEQNVRRVKDGLLPVGVRAARAWCG